jgi:DNA-binding XRE family transcriptional regulator
LPIVRYGVGMAREDPADKADREAREAAAAREVGFRLKALRVRARISQAEAGEKVGVGQPMVARLEAGERTLTWFHAMRFLDLYGAPIEALAPEQPFKVPQSRRKRVLAAKK